MDVNEHGMILPIMTLMVSCMLLVAGYFFSTSVMSLYLTKNQYQQAVNFQEAQLALKKISNQTNFPAACDIPFQTNAKFISEPWSWWQTHGCNEGEGIYYVYMPIHEAPCDFLTGRSVSYTEVIIRAGERHKSVIGALLALPSRQILPCKLNHHELTRKLLGIFLLT